MDTLSNTGKFSERVGELFNVILNEDGDIELGLGLGMNGGTVAIVVTVNDRMSTAFVPREAMAVVKIISETMEEVSPDNFNVKRVLDHLAANLSELAGKADELQQEQVERRLN